MSRPLTCGPFAATGNDDNATIIFHINTQGDWVNTPEGHQKLKEAQTAIANACERGLLPDTTSFEYRGDDSAVVKIPCDSWAFAMKHAPTIKELIPDMIGAVATDIARTRT